MSITAVDTSVAVPLLIDRHPDHPRVFAWARGRRLALVGHGVAEAYAVLTRLRGLQISPAQATRLLSNRFEQRLALPTDVANRAPEVLAEVGIRGGATYDGLVALAARAHALPLASRDRRAHQNYVLVGVEVEIVA